MLRTTEHVRELLDSSIDLGIVVRVKEITGTLKPLSYV